MGVHVTHDELEKIIRLKLEPIENSLNFKDDEHRKLLERVANLEKTVKTLELENNALKAQLNTTISKVKENVALLDEQEQYMRRECVEIKGIPTSRDENTNEVVKQVAGLLDIELGEDDISISHRLPPIPPWTDEDGTHCAFSTFEYYSEVCKEGCQGEILQSKVVSIWKLHRRWHGLLNDATSLLSGLLVNDAIEDRNNHDYYGDVQVSNNFYAKIVT
ncbi:hypothetical protein ACROYT_G039366 [Oculina patagonica]